MQCEVSEKMQKSSINFPSELKTLRLYFFQKLSLLNFITFAIEGYQHQLDCHLLIICHLVNNCVL